MGRLAALLVAGALGMDASAAGAACVGLGQARALVQAGTIVPLMSALGAARGATKGEMIAGSLCGSTGNYRYVVTFLRTDGRVVRVTIDARTGEVVSVK